MNTHSALILVFLIPGLTGIGCRPSDDIREEVNAGNAHDTPQPGNEASQQNSTLPISHHVCSQVIDYLRRANASDEILDGVSHFPWDNMVLMESEGPSDWPEDFEHIGPGDKPLLRGTRAELVRLIESCAVGLRLDTMVLDGEPAAVESQSLIEEPNVIVGLVPLSCEPRRYYSCIVGLKVTVTGSAVDIRVLYVRS